jgi:hypothetical protein
MLGGTPLFIKSEVPPNPLLEKYKGGGEKYVSDDR